MKLTPATLEALTGTVAAEIAACLRAVSAERLAEAAALVEAAPRVFVVGAGRSGLVMRALAMRLMHLGKTAHVVGETTTPAITTGDLLVIGSGSGRTAGLLSVAEKARRHGAGLLVFTREAASPLGRLANHCVVILAPLPDSAPSVQPMGTLFEQCLLVLGDSLVLGLMQRAGEGPSQMLARHANLE